MAASPSLLMNVFLLKPRKTRGILFYGKVEAIAMSRDSNGVFSNIFWMVRLAESCRSLMKCKKPFFKQKTGIK